MTPSFGGSCLKSCNLNVHDETLIRDLPKISSSLKIIIIYDVTSTREGEN